MALKILIVGGGCGGPALAYWLARTGHQVTVVERHPDLRDTGAQIDIRAQGIEVVKRMGLMDEIRKAAVDEKGISFVDSHGRARGTIMANTSGQGAQTFTSEFEIMRGDLVRLLYDASKDDVKWIFGTTVERFEENEKKVTAYFSDGKSDTYDLLVGADGQGSRIRKAILPPGTDPYYRLGVHIAYFFVPRIEQDTNICDSYLGTGGRMIMRRSHSPTETQAYFMVRDRDPKLQNLFRLPVEEQKAFWAERFRGAGWQAERFIDGLKTAENFYTSEIVQVRNNTLHKGRVVLMGDAAHCPSPFTGMGTTTSFVDSYVLAGEINRHADNLPLAFANYEHKVRPFMNDVQNISPTWIRLALPDSQWFITILHWLVAVICFFRIPELLARITPEAKGGWRLPEYPELKY